MKKLVFYIVLAAAVLLTVAGCEQVAQSVADPNSGLNQAVDTINSVVPVVGSGAMATGTPWGAIVGLAATIIATVTGVYNNHRKKVVIDEKDAHIQNTETATKAIIEAVEELKIVELKDGTTLGDTVKEAVKARLQDKDFYKIGKAVISGLKG